MRGQLAILLPQPEVRYAFTGEAGYMFPRADGIVLGGTFERGIWETDAGARGDRPHHRVAPAAVRGLPLHRLIFLLLALACPATAVAATPAEVAAAIDRELRAAEAEGFGGAVIVERGGETLVRHGYGFADRERRVRFTPETIGQIGSITKTFTALAVARLVAEGRIDPEATVGAYLPEAPEPGRSRVVNDLLAHRSGLTDYCGDDFERLSAERLLSECLARPLAHPQGENHYSNMAYSVLALIVERVARQDWESHLAASVWRPLGMAATGFAFAGANPSRLAWGYRDGAINPPISWRIAALGGEDRNLRGNGGMQASADDMIRFLRALTGRDPAIPDAARRLMLAPHAPRHEGVAEGWGLFFRYDEAGAIVRAGHGGSDGVFFSYIAWFPQSGTILYFVGNNGEPAVVPVLQRVLRHVEGLPAA